ncbi:MAG TPA: hypothetical protein VGB53_03665 [Rubricoccaceae bacterium]|jgi:hypothetical protein
MLNLFSFVRRAPFVALLALHVAGCDTTSVRASDVHTLDYLVPISGDVTLDAAPAQGGGRSLLVRLLNGTERGVGYSACPSSLELERLNGEAWDRVPVVLGERPGVCTSDLRFLSSRHVVEWTVDLPEGVGAGQFHVATEVELIAAEGSGRFRVATQPFEYGP